MKKKLSMLLLLAVLVCSLTGCMQITYHITLNNNGTADAEYEMYMSKEYVSMIAGEDNGDPFEENKRSAEAAGFTVETVETDTQSGFKASAKNLEINISDMVNSVGMGGDAKSDVQVKKGLFKNTYTVSANIDTTNIMGTDEESQSMIPLFNQAIDIKLLFTAPSEIISETGTPSKTEANTYEYKSELGKDNQISFSYTLLNMTNIYIFAGVILILLILLVFFLVKKLKKKPEAMEDFIPIDETVSGTEENEIEENTVESANPEEGSTEETVTEAEELTETTPEISEPEEETEKNEEE